MRITAIKRLVVSFSLVAYILSSTACGVILYPERQGQKGGKIDLAVAFLDGIGLLLWVVPGLVAFAVDFHQGTIYLPNSQAAIDAGEDEYREVKVHLPMTMENIEAVLQQELDMPIDLSDERAIVRNISIEELQNSQSLASLVQAPKA